MRSSEEQSDELRRQFHGILKSKADTFARNEAARRKKNDELRRRKAKRRATEELFMQYRRFAPR